MRILIAEDDDHIRNGLSEVLCNEGYETILARDGEEALSLYESESPDFICLDIMMPAENGYDVCRKIRTSDPAIPIIFISAKSEEIDKVLGLELGADDFIMKPFGIREVVARIRAVTRRYMVSKTNGHSREPFQMKDIVVYPSELRARRGDEEMDLSLRDVKILQTLYDRKGEVVDRDTFFNECWGMDYLPNSRTLDQHVSQLRKRVEIDPKNPEIIQTVHGMGYRFEE